MVGVKALLFDFDGLLVDTETANAQAWQEVFDTQGVRLSLPEWAAHWSAGSGDRLPTVEWLSRRATRPVDRELVTDVRRRRYRELVADLPLRPGIGSWLVRAAELGLRLAVVSNGRAENVRRHLHRLGVDGFEYVVAPDDPAERKPSPELYLRALRLLGIAADEALAFEDSPRGVRAATRAGVRCVAVPTAVSVHLSFPGAWRVVSEPAAVPLDAVVAPFESREFQR
jgi:HAD superfamily hydrolase (TIGR01509 family)